MYADLALDNKILKDLFTKKAGPCRKKATKQGVGIGGRHIGEQGLQAIIITKKPVLLSNAKG